MVFTEALRMRKRIAKSVIYAESSAKLIVLRSFSMHKDICQNMHEI